MAVNSTPSLTDREADERRRKIFLAFPRLPNIILHADGQRSSKIR